MEEKKNVTIDFNMLGLKTFFKMGWAGGEGRPSQLPKGLEILVYNSIIWALSPYFSSLAFSKSGRIKMLG